MVIYGFFYFIAMRIKCLIIPLGTVKYFMSQFLFIGGYTFTLRINVLKQDDIILEEIRYFE